MVTVICQYTGIEFEAQTRRTKNHPRVAAVLDYAINRRQPGAYGKAKELFAEAKLAGLTDIDEIIKSVELALDDFDAGRQASIRNRLNAKRDQERRRQQERQQRKATNSFLRKHGYTWQKETEESMDFAGPNAFSGREWNLYASDGRCVSVSQALEEIEAAK